MTTSWNQRCCLHQVCWLTGARQSQAWSALAGLGFSVVKLLSFYQASRCIRQKVIILPSRLRGRPFIIRSWLARSISRNASETPSFHRAHFDGSVSDTYRTFQPTKKIYQIAGECDLEAKCFTQARHRSLVILISLEGYEFEQIGNVAGRRQ